MIKTNNLKLITMKELALTFNGRGEVKGFDFKQLKFNGKLYLYEVTNTDNTNTHYEVFTRRVHTQFNCVSYPNSKACGNNYFCYKSKPLALNMFDTLTTRLNNKP